jgi:cation transport regulator
VPYNSISDIPSRVKQALTSEHQQRAWLEAFNAALKTYDGDEKKAFAVAWAAAKKAHRPKKD